MQKLAVVLLTTAPILLSGCVTKPTNIIPVKNFQADKYLGKWYEIARFDNSFEKGMTNVYAEYSLNPDGTIKVVNSGITPSTGEKSYTIGVAKFDENYKYAYVTGADKDYLWLLARTQTVPQNIKDDFINRAKALGYDTDKLVWVKQNEIGFKHKN